MLHFHELFNIEQDLKRVEIRLDFIQDRFTALFCWRQTVLHAAVTINVSINAAEYNRPNAMLQR